MTALQQGLAWWLGGLFGTLLLTPLALAYARHRQLLDLPGARRSHVAATPRGGGSAIVLVMLLALGLAAMIWPAQRMLLLAMWVGLLLVAAAGWVDDHRPTSPWSRLLVHALAAMLLAAGAYVQGAGAWQALAAFVFAVCLVNVWNFMDGIDGIATSQAGVGALGAALLGGSAEVAVAMALLGACCGFLPFNAPRARIFLGDVGSGALGYLLAGLLVLVMVRRDSAGWLLLCLPMMAFIIDASFTLLRRIVRRERWWDAHVQHVYQRMAKAKGAHMPVTVRYLAWSVLAVTGVMALRDARIEVVLVLIAAWFACTSLLWWIQHQRHPLMSEPAA